MAQSRILRLTTTLVNIAWWIVVVVFALQIGFAIYGIVTPGSTTPVLAHTSLSLRELGLSIDVPLQGFDASSVRQLSGLFFAIGILTAGFVFFVLSHVKGILRITAAGTPFVRESGLRVRAIGFAVLGWAVYSTLVQAVFGSFLAAHVTFPGVALNVKVEPSIETVIFGLLLLVLSEVMRYGVELQEEHDLTV